jgi:hypothetical protein
MAWIWTVKCAILPPLLRQNKWRRCVTIRGQPVSNGYERHNYSDLPEMPHAFAEQGARRALS